MKKAILALLILASVSVSAQKKETKEAAQKAATATAKDSIDINKVPLFTLQDMEQLDRDLLQEMPSKYTDLIRAWIRQRLQQKLQPQK